MAKANQGGGTFAALQSRLAMGKKTTTPARLKARAAGKPQIHKGNPTFAVKK